MKTRLSILWQKRALLFSLCCYFLGFFFNPLSASSSKDESGPPLPNLIRARCIVGQSITFQLSQEFTKKFLKKPLRLVYPSCVELEKLPLSILDIPVIAYVIPVIWLSGKEFMIEEMDEQFYYSLEKVKLFFKRFFYQTAWEGALKPKRLVKNVLEAPFDRSAALFTGGVDSTATALRHREKKTVLLSFNAPHVQAKRFAQALGFELEMISFNYLDCLKLTQLDKVSCEISKWFWDTSMGLTWVGAAAPLLYALQIPKLYIPSGFTWRSFIFPDGQTLRQPASPLIDENLAPFGLAVTHDSFFLTRTEKIAFISDFYQCMELPFFPFIVCNHQAQKDTHYRNCGRCPKCLLTQLDLMALGQNLKDWGFATEEKAFMAYFQEYLLKLRGRRGGTYAALRDTQRYVQDHKELLLPSRLSFFEWFAAFDLWSIVNESGGYPLRSTPFRWEDYADLYPGVIHFTEKK